MLVFFDIETIPQQPEHKAKSHIADTIKAPSTMKKAETIDDWHAGKGKYAGVKEDAIETAYRSTSFDGAKGEIISLAWAFGMDGEIQSVSRDIDGDEKSMLKTFIDSVNSQSINGSTSGTPYFIGHDVARFDMNFLFKRCVILGVNPVFNIKFDGYHNKDYFCTMKAWCGYSDKINQNNLCKALGLEGKPSHIDGSKVWDFARDGKVGEVEEYNRDDVLKVRRIYKRLNYIGEK